MLEEAQKSPIFARAKSFQHIPYGLDLRLLEQADAPTANVGSRLLPTILFGAEDLKNARKGVKYAIEAINELAALAKQSSIGLKNDTTHGSLDSLGDYSKRLRLWTFGKQLSSDLLNKIDPAVVVKQWGFVSDRVLQGQLYRAADVFWLPSLEDNQPQTALEAMACGTPVIGFSVGGVPEIVRNDQTGLIVSAKDSKAMAFATADLLRDRKRLARLSAAGKLMVRQEFSPQRQAVAYMGLYEKILSERRGIFQTPFPKMSAYQSS